MMKKFFSLLLALSAGSLAALDAVLLSDKVSPAVRNNMIRKALDATPAMTVTSFEKTVFYPDPYAGPAADSLSEAEQLMRAGEKPAAAAAKKYGDPAAAKFAFTAEKTQFSFRMETPAESLISAEVECLSPISFTMNFGSVPGQPALSPAEGLPHIYYRTYYVADTVSNGVRSANLGMTLIAQYYYRGIAAVRPGVPSVWKFKVTFRTPEKEAVWTGDVVMPSRSKKNIADAQTRAVTEMTGMYYPPKDSNQFKPGDLVYDWYADMFGMIPFYRDRFGMPNRLAFPKEYSMRYLCEQVGMEQVKKNVADSVAWSREAVKNRILMDQYLTGRCELDAVARPNRYRQALRLEAIRNHVFSSEFTEE